LENDEWIIECRHSGGQSVVLVKIL
jgi:hypothetical protein